MPTPLASVVTRRYFRDSYTPNFVRPHLQKSSSGTAVCFFIKQPSQGYSPPFMSLAKQRYCL